MTSRGRGLIARAGKAGVIVTRGGRGRGRLGPTSSDILTRILRPPWNLTQGRGLEQCRAQLECWRPQLTNCLHLDNLNSLWPRA